MPTLHEEHFAKMCTLDLEFFLQSAKSKVRLYEMKKRHGYLAYGARALKRMRAQKRTLEIQHTHSKMCTLYLQFFFFSFSNMRN